MSSITTSSNLKDLKESLIRLIYSSSIPRDAIKNRVYISLGLNKRYLDFSFMFYDEHIDYMLDLNDGNTFTKKDNGKSDRQVVTNENIYHFLNIRQILINFGEDIEKIQPTEKIGLLTATLLRSVIFDYLIPKIEDPTFNYYRFKILRKINFAKKNHIIVTLQGLDFVDNNMAKFEIVLDLDDTDNFLFEKSGEQVVKYPLSTNDILFKVLTFVYSQVDNDEEWEMNF